MGTVVIVGAGLASSLAASRLIPHHRVVVIEQTARNRPLAVSDSGRSAMLDPHIGSGPGGTTYLWHNGLIQLEADDYASWPLSAAELKPYLPAAHEALSGASMERVHEIATILRTEFAREGVEGALLGEPLFYPSQRRNVWHSGALTDKGVSTVVGCVERLEIDDSGRVRAAVLAGQPDSITGDIFILAAGGLGSPIILQASGGSFRNAGRYYFDHPGTFVCEIVSNANLQPLWNRFDGLLKGSVRLPLVITIAQQKFAFYLRPAGLKREVKSMISDLRNSPFDPRNYFRMLMHTNDIIEVLSLRAGINIPIRRFWLYMTAEQLPQDDISICKKSGKIIRNWQLDHEFFVAADDAIEAALSKLAPVIERALVLEGWPRKIQTGAHHSGTCRMALTAETGICDKDCRVFGISNLFVCDGSVLPSAGYANTGLTIGALALRLGEMIH